MVRVLLIIILLLSLGACDQASIPPRQITSEMETTQLTTTALKTITVTTLPDPVEVIRPSPTNSPTPVPTSLKEVRVTMTPAPRSLTSITIIYDNNQHDPRLKSDWGFSALVEHQDDLLLFDTGGYGNILLENMKILGINPADIQSIVLSHAHGDHTGGLGDLLKVAGKPAVYLLPSFPHDYKLQTALATQVIEVTPGQRIGDGISTTGEISGNTPEQALLVRTGRGLVIITGCAHPGIVRIIEHAIELTGDPVYLVVGGFHLGDKSKSDLSGILMDFRRLGVQKVAPCHCSGERAIAMFADEYGEDFLRVGAGSIISVETQAQK